MESVLDSKNEEAMKELYTKYTKYFPEYGAFGRFLELEQEYIKKLKNTDFVPWERIEIRVLMAGLTDLKLTRGCKDFIYDKYILMHHSSTGYAQQSYENRREFLLNTDLLVSLFNNPIAKKNALELYLQYFKSENAIPDKSFLDFFTENIYLTLRYSFMYNDFIHADAIHLRAESNPELFDTKNIMDLLNFIHKVSWKGKPVFINLILDSIEIVLKAKPELGTEEMVNCILENNIKTPELYDVLTVLLSKRPELFLNSVEYIEKGIEGPNSKEFLYILLYMTKHIPSLSKEIFNLTESLIESRKIREFFLLNLVISLMKKDPELTEKGLSILIDYFWYDNFNPIIDHYSPFTSKINVYDILINNPNLFTTKNLEEVVELSMTRETGAEMNIFFVDNKKINMIVKVLEEKIEIATPEIIEKIIDLFDDPLLLANPSGTFSRIIKYIATEKPELFSDKAKEKLKAIINDPNHRLKLHIKYNIPVTLIAEELNKSIEEVLNILNNQNKE
ncbi:MAG: hypothetical protein WC356_01430 [Candidatus Micrarchaeia archaeon]|jgi:hypothetical protein